MKEDVRSIEGTAMNFGKRNYTVRSWVYAAVSLFLLIQGMLVFSENLWLFAVLGFLAACAAIAAGRKGEREHHFTADKAGMVLAVLAVMEFISNWAL